MKYPNSRIPLFLFRVIFPLQGEPLILTYNNKNFNS